MKPCKGRAEMGAGRMGAGKANKAREVFGAQSYRASQCIAQVYPPGVGS